MKIDLKLSKYLKDYLKHLYDPSGSFPDHTICIDHDSKIATYIIPYLKYQPGEHISQTINFHIILNWKLKFFDEKKNYLSQYDQNRFQHTVNYMFMHDFALYLYRRRVKNILQLPYETQKEIILSFCDDYHISFDWDADVYDTLKKRLYRHLKYKK